MLASGCFSEVSGEELMQMVCDRFAQRKCFHVADGQLFLKAKQDPIYHEFIQKSELKMNLHSKL